MKRVWKTVRQAYRGKIRKRAHSGVISPVYGL